MPPELPLGIGVTVFSVAAFAFASWRDHAPADPLKPRLVPWRTVIVVSGTVAFHGLLYVISLFRAPTDLGF
jgi:hypothetical protein